MAGLADNPAAQRLIEGMSSIGVNFPDPSAVTDDQLRLETVKFINFINQLVADNPTIVTSVDTAVLQSTRDAIRTKLEAPNEHGKTPLQFLRALADGNTEFLVEDVTGYAYGLVSKQGYARNEFNRIFRSSGTKAENALEALEFAAENDPETKKLLDDLRANAPGILNNLPAAVALLEGSDDLVADLQTLVDQNLYAGQAINPADLAAGGAEEYRAAVTALEGIINSSEKDGTWADADARAMQTFFRNMQSGGYFGEGWTGPKDGVYDDAFRAHLDAKLAAIPANDPMKAQLQGLLTNIDVLLARSVTLTPPHMDVRSATKTVEESLMVLAPNINGMLDKVTDGNDGNSLVALFQSFAQIGILDHRIPEISAADENFDLRSQAALQGLMIFLSDPMVMNIPGENNWYYTPEKGQFILANIDNLKNKIKQMIGEEEYNAQNLDELLKAENLQPFIDSLDFLAKQDPPRIAQQLLFNQGDFEAAPYVEKLFQSMISTPQDQTEIDYLSSYGAHRIAGMAENNPDMLQLMDVLTREFSGQFGLLDLMPDLENADAVNDIDGAITREQRLSTIYKAARAKHEENGHGATLSDDLYIMISTINTLPFGSSEYRRNYQQMMREAIDAASAISNPDEAARVFSERVAQGMDRLYEQHGAPQYTQPYERDAPSWKPGLENLTITSGGQQFGATEMAAFYDNYHIMTPGNPFREELQTDLLALHGYVSFKDDDGNTYIAGIDKQSMVFSIEKIDLEALQIIHDDASLNAEERRAKFLEDPGFALLAGTRDVEAAIADVFITRRLDNANVFKTVSEGYQSDVDGLREQRDAAQAERDAYIPPYARSVQTTPAQQPTTVDRFNPAAQEPTVFDDPTRSRGQIIADINALRDFANMELNAKPRVIAANDTATMAMLRRNDIRDANGDRIKLPIGRSMESTSLSVEKVELPPEGASGQMLAYYDRSKEAVVVVQMPAYLSDPRQRAAIKALTEDGRDSEAFMRRVERDYPELFAVTQEYRTGGHGGGITAGPLSRDEYTEFKRAMRAVIIGLESDIQDQAYVPPGVERQPRDFRDNMERAGRGIINTPGRIVREIDDRYGYVDYDEFGKGIGDAPGRIADGFISVVNGIGARVEEAVDIYNGDRPYNDRSHQVHGIATGAPEFTSDGR